MLQTPVVFTQFLYIFLSVTSFLVCPQEIYRDLNGFCLFTYLLSQSVSQLAFCGAYFDEEWVYESSQPATSEVEFLQGQCS